MKHERLTERTKNGGVKFSNDGYYNICYPQNTHCLRDIDRMAIKLCEYEDKIERGTLVELPFKVGDKVFKVCKYLNAIKQLEITSIEIAYNGIKFSAYAEDFTPTIFPESKIGKTIFLTREEAEKAFEGEKR